MTVETLKWQRREKKQKIEKYEERINDIETILSNIDNKLDDDVEAVNKQISRCIDELEVGLKGVGTVRNISSSLSSMKEKHIGSDSKLNSCRSSLRKEQKRCYNKIDSLHSEITTVENKIKSEGGTIYFWE